MNKTQLIDAIQKELGPDATKKCAADALNATLAAITKARSRPSLARLALVATPAPVKP